MTISKTPCNCLAIRQAARHMTHLYDQLMASTGLRSTQFSVLMKLERNGLMTISDLSAQLVMDRTTLGRNLLPLQREGLVSITKQLSDRRNKEIQLTKAGVKRLCAASKKWNEAQTRFEAAFGVKRARKLRALAGAVVAVPIMA
jgi:DNA-binding MarR family transcriptional regulator